MKVNVLGTACTWFTRLNTSYVIDEKILLDVSQGNYKEIAKVVKDIYLLDAILISHTHRDHVLDLFIITTRFVRHYKGKKKLKIYAPAGTMEQLIAFNALFAENQEENTVENLNRVIEFIDLKDGMKFNINEYTITAYKMNHASLDAYGFSFDDGKTVVGFSADTASCENLDKLVSSSNYIFLECADKKPSKNHLCLDEYLMFVEKNKDKVFYPVHTSDECQKYFEENNLNALKDGQIIKI